MVEHFEIVLNHDRVAGIDLEKKGKLGALWI